MNRSTVFLVVVAALTGPLGLAAQTLDLPQRKAGLWEIAMEGIAGKSFTSLMCIDAATDREMMDYALKQAGGDCKNAVKRQGSTYTVDSECTVSGTPVRSKTVVSGDFTSAYTVRTEGTMGTESMLITQTAKWKSADCAGMKPGDIGLLGGIKLNIKQMKSPPGGGMH